MCRIFRSILKHSLSLPNFRFASNLRYSISIPCLIMPYTDGPFNLTSFSNLLITGVFFWFGGINLRKGVEKITQRQRIFLRFFKNLILNSDFLTVHLYIKNFNPPINT